MTSSDTVIGQDPLSFSDDEILPAARHSQTSDPDSLQNVSIKAVPEHNAVAASESIANFSVLVNLRAPPLSDSAARAPIDLVMVLDVSGSMQGLKLNLVKRAVGFIIDNLDPSDRLSVVTFSSSAERVFPLRRMTEQGRTDAKTVVSSLVVSGNTNIFEGLTMGLRVLDESCHRNPVASIIFLSDGNSNMGQPPPYLNLSDRKPSVPIHAFGFGEDHDPLAMHAIADSTGGTFSFVKSYEMVQDAFAKCIGGLLSVVVRDLCLTLMSASYGVGINSIPSGNYASEISDQGSRGEITVGEMYADEVKEFLIDISVPVYSSVDVKDEENDRTTSLLDITCSYKDAHSNERVEIEFAEIRRPGVPSPSDVKVKLEVDRQRNRLDAAEGLANAQRAAESGDLKGARDILFKKRSSILASESGQAGDGLSLQLEAEMKETEQKMVSKGIYEQVGRAYALSSMSANANQRASTRGLGGPSTDAYATPNMDNMVNKSRLIKIENVKQEKS